MSFFPTPVVVATDGGEASQKALLTATELCRATGSPLHLVHAKIVAATVRGRPMNPAQRAATEDEGQTLLERAATAVAEAGGDVAGRHLRHGQQADRILHEVMEELGAGLLVVAGGRTGSLVHRLLDAGGESAVRGTDASVLVVR